MAPRRGAGTALRIHILSRHRPDCGDDVLQFGDLTEGATSRDAFVLGHPQDEVALVRLQAFGASVDLVGQGQDIALANYF